MNRALILVVACTCLFTARIVTGDVVVLESSKDNTLYEDDTGALSNGGGEHFFAGRTADEPPNSPDQGDYVLRRGLLAFDLAGQIPAGSVIDSVILTLYLNRTRSGDQTVALHRVLADWGEGTSDAPGGEGVGAPSTSGDATWVHRFFDTSLWTTPGGDFSSTLSASASVSGNGFYTWGSTAQMVADVQGWLNDPSTNFGWLLRGNEDSPLTDKRFDTKENGTAVNRPVLTVDFTTLQVETPMVTATFTATLTPTDTPLALPTPTPNADLNNDGFVDSTDLLLFHQRWHTGQQSPKITPTPTPTGVGNLP